MMSNQRARPIRLSVVVPSFNQGRFIGEALDSILDQDGAGESFELQTIIQDGGSTDDTVTILEGMGDRIEWVSEPDGGQAAAVNLGWQKSDGSILGWLNSDDLYLPGALRSVVEAFDRDPGVDVIYGEGVYVDAAGRRIGRYGTKPFDAMRLRDECYICQPTVFIRRSVFERWGGPGSELRYCMDYEYWLRLSEHVRFLKLDRELAVTRWYPDTKTLGQRYGVHHEICTMLRCRLGYVPLSWIGAWTSVWLEGLPGLRRLRRFRVLWLLLILGTTLGNALRHSGLRGLFCGLPGSLERLKRLRRRVSGGRETGLDDEVFEHEALS